MNENIFLKHKFLLFTFLFVFVIFMFCHYYNSVGLYFDTPATFFSVLYSHTETVDKFLMFGANRVRWFNFFFAAIPFNIVFSFLKDTSVINLLNLYSTSFFIVQFFAILFSYFVALRTKRYDIIAVSYLFYAMFSIPNFIWVLRETHIVFLLYFALLAYFLSKEKLKKLDYVIVGLLLIYMFESFETTLIFGLILFVFSIIKRNSENSKMKLFIGLSSLLVVVYIPIKMYYFSIVSNHDLFQGISQWMQGSTSTLQNLFVGNNFIVCFGILFVFSLLFYKKKLSFLFLLIVFVVFFCFLCLKIGFYPNPMVELQNYSFGLWFIFPVLMSFMFFEIKNTNICSNIFVIACIFGIINLFWQINSCYEFGKYTKYLKNLIQNTNKTVVFIPKEDFANYKFLEFNSCFGMTHKAILLTQKGEKSKIIMPSEYFCDYSKYCYEDVENTYYDKKNNILYLQTAQAKPVTRFWDLTSIIEEFEKQGRVKSN